MNKILKAFKDGWQHGGIGWRTEFVAKNINPDAFLRLPGAKELLRQYNELPSQKKTIFLNTLYRQYEFLRND